MSTTAEPGLRERKKAATRQALHEAAVRLAIEHGAERVTVEAIADDAGVSRRTFSNYFGSKEEALMYGDFQRIQSLIEMVRERPAEESAWAALTAAAERFVAELGDLDPQWVAQGRLVRAHPTLIAAQVQTFAALERELSAEVASRSKDQDPNSVRVKMTSATFLVALRVALHLWLEGPPGRSLWGVVEEALAQAGRGFAYRSRSRTEIAMPRVGARGIALSLGMYFGVAFLVSPTPPGRAHPLALASQPLKPAKILLNSNGDWLTLVHWNSAPLQAFLSRLSSQKDTKPMWLLLAKATRSWASLWVNLPPSSFWPSIGVTPIILKAAASLLP
jgi:AcrR family transcriptional regulator